MRVAQAGENLFDRIEVLLAQVNLTERQNAIWREIAGRKRLIPKPVKGGDVAFVPIDHA